MYKAIKAASCFLIILFCLTSTFNLVCALELEEIFFDDNSAESSVNAVMPDIFDDGGTLTRLFTLYANHVEDTLNTSGVDGKGLYRRDLPDNADIYVTGHFSHSVTEYNWDEHRMIRTGLCSYDPQIQEMVDDFKITPAPGEFFSEKLCEKVDLRSEWEYYAFVTNTFTSGYVYGQVSIEIYTN